MKTRQVKGISFTEEYTNEYIQLSKESNGSLLVCELLREYYNNDYNMQSVKRDMVQLKSMLADIMQMLEVSDYE